MRRIATFSTVVVMSFGLGCSDNPAEGGPSAASSPAEMTGTGEGPTATGTSEAGGLVTEPVSFVTTDGKTIQALFHTDRLTPAGAPGVLLVHQYLQSKTQWDPYVDDLTALGFLVLAIDLRGHGESDAQDGSLNALLNDPDQAPLDVQAGLAWLDDVGGADPSRTAIVGTSIGANLACVANTLGYGAKLSVAISPRDTAVDSLAGKPDALSFRGLYCLAASNDSGGAQAKTCAAFVAQAAAPSQEVIVAASFEHGVAVLSEHPGEWGKILAWLAAEL